MDGLSVALSLSLSLSLMTLNMIIINSNNNTDNIDTIRILFLITGAKGHALPLVLFL